MHGASKAGVEHTRPDSSRPQLALSFGGPPSYLQEAVQLWETGTEPTTLWNLCGLQVLTCKSEQDTPHRCFLPAAQGHVSDS